MQNLCTFALFILFLFFKPTFIVAEIHLYLAQMECSFATTVILISLLQLPQKHDAHFPKPKPTVTSTASRFCSCKRQFFAAYHSILGCKGGLCSHKCSQEKLSICPHLTAFYCGLCNSLVSLPHNFYSQSNFLPAFGDGWPDRTRCMGSLTR